ncbi:MAG: hypothetical protein E6905_06690, partial [Actinomyces sp.]|nr:hypothetical protein [Actinomyces sp.]
YRAQQSSEKVRTNPMKPAHDLSAALRWKKTLDIRDQKHQNTEQHCYLEYVIKRMARVSRFSY